jgi:GAF domain-containing protein
MSNIIKLSQPAGELQLSEKDRFYRSLAQGVAALLEGERDFLANMANVSALLYEELPDVHWAGFYLLKGQDLVLGPFQGKVACTRIGPGKGVCGAAAKKRESVVVKNVNRFPGHIACDSRSQSEIVVPLVKAGRLLGVLDLDSAMLARFDDEDRAGLEEIVRLLVEASKDTVLGN